MYGFARIMHCFLGDEGALVRGFVHLLSIPVILRAGSEELPTKHN